MKNSKRAHKEPKLSHLPEEASHLPEEASHLPENRYGSPVSVTSDWKSWQKKKGENEVTRIQGCNLTFLEEG